MPEPLATKTISVELTTRIPLKVVDDQGRTIGSAYVGGSVDVVLELEKNHPATFDLATNTGLARLKLSAHVEDNIVDGVITIGG